MIVVEQLRIRLAHLELELHWVGLSPMRFKNLESSLGVFISKKLPGDANTADPKTSISKVVTLHKSLLNRKRKEYLAEWSQDYVLWSADHM